MSNTNKKREVKEWTVKDLISKVESGELDLDTEYQRDPVWLKPKKELLIDSILTDIDIPKIYLAYFSNEKHYECIDGKQRITSVIDFYNGDLKTPTGEKYTALKKEDQRLFLDYKFIVTIIQNPTPEEISELFLRVNIGTPLNGGEHINAMRGDLKSFIFKEIGREGPFIGKAGMKEYRFSREIALSQMAINSLSFREDKSEFVRARYEDIRKFFELPNHKKFNSEAKKKAEEFRVNLKKAEAAFGDKITKLTRKSAIVSAYLFCEIAMSKGKEKDLKKFAEFYIELLAEMKRQADMIPAYKIPTNKIILEEFQKNLQQASAERYSFRRRQEFLEKAFVYYQKSGKIIGESS